MIKKKKKHLKSSEYGIKNILNIYFNTLHLVCMEISQSSNSH